MSARVADYAGGLQLVRSVRHAVSAQAQHMGDQFVRHDEFVGLHEVEAHHQPAAKSSL